MKWFYLILISSQVCAQDDSLVCTASDYLYTGAHYSDVYTSVKVDGIEACHTRKKMDAEKLGQLHKENRILINQKIDVILGEPRCTNIQPIVTKYREKIRTHKEIYTQKQDFRTEFLKKDVKTNDVQRQFAFYGAYSTTCSSEQNGEVSFIDLDTINELIPAAVIKKIQVTENNAVVKSCADVQASGFDDLKTFTVSMAKAISDSFLLVFDPYSVPDQVIVKNSAGDIIHDSGCVGDVKEPNVQVSLSKLGPDKNIIIDVVNNCSDPVRGKGVSGWEINIQCQEKSEAPEPCTDKRLELVELLKKEVELNKNFLDVNATEIGCFVHFDREVLNELVTAGLIRISGAPKLNGTCDMMDEECVNKRNLASRKEIKKSANIVKPAYHTLQGTRSPAQNPGANCKARPGIEKSVLELVSWAYCSITKRNLD